MPTILGRLHESALTGQTDAELLRRFVAAGATEAEAAFAVLVRRHGPTVFRVCGGTLRDRHAAEDAFQATFLVLATRARSLSPQTALGPWLWEVARRVSARARAAAARRRAVERAAAAMKATGGTAAGSEADVAAAVLDAVGRLPARYRAAVLLCHTEGLSYQEAADRLGVSAGAVRNRLARGRRQLRALLRRMGVAPGGAVVALSTAPAVSRALVAATSRAAVLVAAGSAEGAVPASILALMTGGLGMSKLKSLCLSAVAAGVLVAGAAGLTAQPQPQKPSDYSRTDPAALVPAEAELSDLRLILDKVADPADRIARLAAEAKRRQAAGDAEGALKAMRQLDDLSWTWQGQLRQQLGRRPASSYGPNKERIPAVHPDSAMPALPGTSAKEPKPSAGGDTEARLRAVEQKLDRLLKSLDRQPAVEPRQ